jgi:hypothetical protein
VQLHERRLDDVFRVKLAAQVMGHAPTGHRYEELDERVVHFGFLIEPDKDCERQYCAD